MGPSNIYRENSRPDICIDFVSVQVVLVEALKCRPVSSIRKYVAARRHF